MFTSAKCHFNPLAAFVCNNLLQNKVKLQLKKESVGWYKTAEVWSSQEKCPHFHNFTILRFLFSRSKHTTDNVRTLNIETSAPQKPEKTQWCLDEMNNLHYNNQTTMITINALRRFRQKVKAVTEKLCYCIRKPLPLTWLISILSVLSGWPLCSSLTRSSSSSSLMLLCLPYTAACVLCIKESKLHD